MSRLKRLGSELNEVARRLPDDLRNLHIFLWGNLIHCETIQEKIRVMLQILFTAGKQKTSVGIFRGFNKGPLETRVCNQLTVMVLEPQFRLWLSAPVSGEQSLLFVSKQSISKEAREEICLRDQRNPEDWSTDLLSPPEDTS